LQIGISLFIFIYLNKNTQEEEKEEILLLIEESIHNALNQPDFPDKENFKYETLNKLIEFDFKSAYDLALKIIDKTSAEKIDLYIRSVDFYNLCKRSQSACSFAQKLFHKVPVSNINLFVRQFCDSLENDRNLKDSSAVSYIDQILKELKEMLKEVEYSKVHELIQKAEEKIEQIQKGTFKYPLEDSDEYPSKPPVTSYNFLKFW
jgi:hypothetical protein